MIKFLEEYCNRLFPSVDTEIKNAVRHEVDQIDMTKSPWFMLNQLDVLSQGDILDKIPFLYMKDDGSKKAYVGKGMVLSNTCDLQRDPYIIIAPLFNMDDETEKKFSEQTKKDLKDNAYLSNEQLNWLKDVIKEGAHKDKPIFIQIHQTFTNTADHESLDLIGEQEEALKEILPDGNEYTYLKLNGVKYYKDINSDQWFSLLNGQKKPQGKFLSKYETTNDLAIKFFTEAKEFSDWFYNHSGLSDLRASDEKGQPLKNLVDERSAVVYEFASNQRIFDNSGHIEDPASVFNNHRLAVIRYTIEKNLSIAIANYNNFTKGASANFQMPNLTEEEWAQIMNNMSMISFLEGLSIGGKVYNGYSIVTNTKTEEVVNTDSIYIIADGEYHRATENGLKSKNIEKAFMNVDFERKSVTNNDKTSYFYPHWETGCYNSIVTQNDVNDLTDDKYKGSIYKYMQDQGGRLAQVYYTALGRERYTMYRTNNNVEEENKKFQKNE